MFWALRIVLTACAVMLLAADLDALAVQDGWAGVAAMGSVLIVVGVLVDVRRSRRGRRRERRVGAGDRPETEPPRSVRSSRPPRRR